MGTDSNHLWHILYLTRQSNYLPDSEFLSWQCVFSFLSAGTSSRSTKLIWGGSRYLVQALVSLFNFDLRLIRSPRKTIHSFTEEFRMVMNCHKERKFLLDTQPHLTNWLPIAVPLKTWIMWPPPFGYPPAALGALGLFPLFFKFVSIRPRFSSLKAVQNRNCTLTNSNGVFIFCSMMP